MDQPLEEARTAGAAREDGDASPDPLLLPLTHTKILVSPNRGSAVILDSNARPGKPAPPLR